MKINKIQTLFLITSLVSVFMLFLLSIGYFDSINLQLSDKIYGIDDKLDNIILIKIDDESINKIGRWPWNREIFANLIEKVNNSQIIVFDLGFYEKSNILNNTYFIETVKKYEDKIVLSVEYIDFEKRDNLIYGKNTNLLFEGLNKHKNVGYTNINIDNDGILRSLNLNILGNYSSLSEKVYELFVGKNYSYSQNRYLINFLKPNSFKSYSFYDVINDNNNKNISKKEFENKIVFIGVSSKDLHDSFFVPTSKAVLMDGVEIHANIFQTMILNNNLKKESNFFIGLIIVIISFIIGIIFYRFKIFYTTIFLFFLFFLNLIFAILLFEKNYILDLIYFPITIILSYISIVIYYYLYEQKGKKDIANAFGKYVSPILIKEIMKKSQKLSLGGERKDIIILFSDIANFTSISEKIEPEELVLFLNQYLTYMTTIILENEGLVDKFIGDAIMAFWGAPIDNLNKVELACETCLKMLEKLDELKIDWKIKYDIDIDIRIGLNYGDVVVGNMGSETRFDYTLIGDNVNLASRLEAINKYYKTRIMISEFVYEKIKNKSTCREIDLVKVKGKEKPIKIYELISMKKPTKKQRDFIYEFEKGLNLYRKMKFLDAIKIFENCKVKYSDKTSQIFIERCNIMNLSKMSKNWDGVFTHNEK